MAPSVSELNSCGDRTLSHLRWPRTRRSTARRRRAFEEVLSEHLDALYRTAVRLCRGHEADAEDLVQDAALRAFQQFHQLRDLEAVRAWLFAILLRTHLNRARAARRRPETTVEDLDEAAFERALEEWRGPEAPDMLLDRSRLAAGLQAALDALPAAFRVVIWLVDVEGFRQREVASMLTIPEGTVASRLYRARRELRAMLTAQGAERGRTRQGGG